VCFRDDEHLSRYLSGLGRENKSYECHADRDRFFHESIRQAFTSPPQSTVFASTWQFHHELAVGAARIDFSRPSKILIRSLFFQILTSLAIGKKNAERDQLLAFGVENTLSFTLT
jgi:hypothetical protein